MWWALWWCKHKHPRFHVWLARTTNVKHLRWCIRIQHRPLDKVHLNTIHGESVHDSLHRGIQDNYHRFQFPIRLVDKNSRDHLETWECLPYSNNQWPDCDLVQPSDFFHGRDWNSTASSRLHKSLHWWLIAYGGILLSRNIRILLIDTKWIDSVFILNSFSLHSLVQGGIAAVQSKLDWTSCCVHLRGCD